MIEFGNEPWMARSACRDEDPDLFYPNASSEDRIAAAKAVCASCPVANECFDYALRTHQRFGVWGGVFVDGQPISRRKRARQAAAMLAARLPVPRDEGPQAL